MISHKEFVDNSLYFSAKSDAKFTFLLEKWSTAWLLEWDAMLTFKLMLGYTTELIPYYKSIVVIHVFVANITAQ